MKNLLTLISIFFVLILTAQPPNDNCSGAFTVTPDGTCVGPGLAETTTVSATDGWTGTVGCAGNNDEVWFEFTATGTQFDYTITAGTIGGNIEMILVESTSPPCAGLALEGSDCGASPLTGTINGLTNGGTYYVTISSTGADGTFTFCPETTTPAPSPGQDCAGASNICDGGGFSVGSVASGNGTVNGNSSEEDLSVMSCFGADEQQSQWYTFTVGAAGTLEFEIDPAVYSSASQNGDDYDWILWETTTEALATECNLNSNGTATAACNWSGCDGSTGLSPTFMGNTPVTDYQDNNPPGPGDCFNEQQWDATVVNASVGDRFILLVDNFSATNSGFDFIFGGTATIGPVADFSLGTCTDPNVDISLNNTGADANWGYEVNWGDGNTDTYTGATLPGTIAHTYGGTGIGAGYTITVTVTDPYGCQATTSVNTCVVLSASFIDVGIKKSTIKPEIYWVVDEEQVAANYIVQRSSNGIDFTNIDYVDGSQRTYIDESAPFGTSWYRIIRMDEDGSMRHSETVKNVYRPVQADLRVYPNPNEGQFQLEVYSYEGDNLSLEVIDVSGRLIQSISVLETGVVTIPVDLTSMGKGIYFVKLSGEEYQDNVRKVVIR